MTGYIFLELKMFVEWINENLQKEVSINEKTGEKA